MPPTLDDVRWIDLPTMRDDRGALTAVEEAGQLPFPIRRVFYLHGVKTDRGGHAHRDTEQLLVAVSGSLRVTLKDGREERTWVLDDPSRGLFMPPLLFVELHDFAPGTVMLALCSNPYDIGASLRSWDAFLAARQEVDR